MCVFVLEPEVGHLSDGGGGAMLARAIATCGLMFQCILQGRTLAIKRKRNLVFSTSEMVAVHVQPHVLQNLLEHVLPMSSARLSLETAELTALLATV